MKVSLNQTYKEKKTFADYPEIKLTYDEITKFTIENDFIDHKKDSRLKGRRYDDAVLFHCADFNDKVVCEIGARDGVFSSWLTKFVKKIYVTDYFESWGKGTSIDLGQIEYWTEIWKKCAYNKDKLQIETQDVTNLTYPDNFFDIVICTSVIEHTYNQCNWNGDKVAMKEIARILKPNGKILMSTDMSSSSKWLSGTYYYSKEESRKGAPVFLREASN
jgi:2-polyprenyl-3-methyl-5-hydroxy-6-metoxy-1,4-benzoquinol methylase